VEPLAGICSIARGYRGFYGIGMKGTTNVYRFRQYDIAADAFRLSARTATQACIRRIHAQLIRSTELEIDKRHLDNDGMTAIMYFERLRGPRPVKTLADPDAALRPRLRIAEFFDPGLG
jgi:hypothetical protein